MHGRKGVIRGLAELAVVQPRRDAGRPRRTKAQGGPEYGTKEGEPFVQLRVTGAKRTELKCEKACAALWVEEDDVEAGMAKDCTAC